MPEVREILNCRFSAVTHDGSLAWSRDIIQTGRRGIITTVNVAILMAMRTNRELREFVHASALTVADGQPVVWLSRIIGRALPERVAGVDLIPGLCDVADELGVGVYFLGSRADVVEEVAKRMTANRKNMKVAGIQHGYFSDSEAESIAEKIRQSNAAILFVGLGVPRQEAFLEKYWNELGVQIAVPIGGSYDMLTDRCPRAARWIQRIGCEWLWRLYLEPRRLFMRYLTSNCQFVVASLQAVVKERLLAG